MHRLKIILLVLLGIALFSCSKDDDPQAFEYQGTWTGNYTGHQDNGSWDINVDNNGAITGTTHSDLFDETSEMEGNVEESGKLTATAESGTIFSGTMSGTSISGTWSNANTNMDGNWRGRKQ